MTALAYAVMVAFLLAAGLTLALALWAVVVLARWAVAVVASALRIWRTGRGDAWAPEPQHDLQRQGFAPTDGATSLHPDLDQHAAQACALTTTPDDRKANQ